LAHEDGSYEWVSPSDYRVAEVRLLHSVETVGEAHPERDRVKDNLLIRGDALNALTSLTELPEFACEYLGQVKLAYLDPPFNTQQSFLHYDDALEHSVWLTMMRDRFQQISSLLAPEGSLWVHLDDTELHRARCVLDEVFGTSNYVTTVIWEKTTSGRNDAQFFSTDQDYLLVYAKNRESLRLNRVDRSLSADKAYRNPDNDPRGPWREIDYKGPKSAQERPNLYYPLTNPTTGTEVWPRRERVWAYGREENARHVRENLLWWGKTGSYSFPKLKKFLTSADPTAVPRTLWSGDEVDTTRRAKDEIKKLFPNHVPFTTPKPEKLFGRIIGLATNPGDVVLDCFLGSGTTAAVAHKMGRRWIGSERSFETVSKFTEPRLRRIVEGQDGGGVTDLADWQGGGSFRMLDVAPSMFEANKGLVFLTEGMTNGKLAEATAAQLHYDYQPDPPFCGLRGRSRLAVIDGLVNPDVVQLLIESLADTERLVICGTAIDPAVRDVLKELRPGSSVRKIPQSILREYRQTPQSGPIILAAALPPHVEKPLAGA
jgi:adenine-specific DNA-methyltransferase